MLPPKFRGKLDTRFFQLNTILLPVQLFLPPKFRGKLDTRFFQLNTILLPVQLFLLAFYSSYIKVAVDKLNQKMRRHTNET